MKLTATGIVPVSHRIPLSAIAKAKIQKKPYREDEALIILENLD